MEKKFISKERKTQLITFCKSVNISFNNLTLLNQAFCHRSITNELKNLKNNERLEFLGDSVLGMVTASYLYNHYDVVEGDLAKIKSVVVSEKILSEMISELIVLILMN